MTTEKLAPYFEKVEKRLSVHVNTGAEINRNSQIMNEGCQKLGYSSKPLSRNIKDCALTGFCLAGCATDRKQSMLVTYIPWAIAKGARVIADTAIEKILRENGKAVGVQGVMTDPATGVKIADVEIRSKVTVLSAGAIQTPVLLQKNDLANGSGMVGKNFACHPSLGILGMFDEKTFGYRGATLGSYCDEFESVEKGGFILEGGTAGAKQVYFPTFAPTVLEHPDDIPRVIAGMTLEPNTLRLTSYHPQGTCRMGADAKASVVAPNGETHDVKNLFIADASLFPTSIMVNPQMTVYALSTYIAEGMLKDWREAL